MLRYLGAADPIKRPEISDDDLQVWYPLGDPHIGLMSWHGETGTDSDLRSAESILYETVDMLVDRAPPAKSGVLCNLGDYFHADGPSQLTQSGHKLDVDSRFSKIADIGFSLMRRMTDRLLQKHESVTVINVPGNHDIVMSRMLALWMRAVYEREPRVTVIESTNPYIYVRFGNNLIGCAHGDGGKIKDLPEIMATDRPKDWGETLHRAWYTGHIHTDTRQDRRGCTVESFRTMAAPDYWSWHTGYRSGRSLNAIVRHKIWGEQGRVTVGIREVERSLKK